VALSIAALLGLAACGDEDSQPLFEALPRPEPGSLYGTWKATRPVAYKLRYDFRRDGTYTHSSGFRQKRKRGTYSFAIRARGTFVVRGRRLVLRPRSGTITRHDPDDPRRDFRRPVDRKRQRYEWSVRRAGDQAKLTLTMGGGLAVIYRRG
jgi:hypothetical protein